MLLMFLFLTRNPLKTLCASQYKNRKRFREGNSSLNSARARLCKREQSARFVSVFSNNYSFSFGFQTRRDVEKTYLSCIGFENIKQEIIFRDFTTISEKNVNE
jgi:hypothetical protein